MKNNLIQNKIPEGWVETSLGDVAAVVKESWKPGDKDMKYVGLEHVNAGDLSLNGFGQSTELASNKFIFKTDDILFGKLRPYFRKVVNVNFDGVCSTDIWVIRSKDGYDQKFLFYFMANPVLINKSMGANTGTHMPRADWNFLENTVWNFPPLPEQQAIATVLSAFEDKIELLREENKTLEEIGQSVFGEWFGKYSVERPEELPEGWRAGRVGDAGNVICGKTPSKENQEYFGGEIPFIKIPDMHGEVFIVKTDDSLTGLGASTQKNKFIPKNSICVSCIATVGLVSITSQNSQTNQQINSIVPNDEKYLEYLYLVLMNMKNDLIAIGSGGSATLNINTSTFLNIEIAIPDIGTLEKFHETVKPVFLKILNNLYQIQSLARSRDKLLLKLMSGEIGVK